MSSCNTPARELEPADGLHPVQPTVLRNIHDEPPSSSSGFKGHPIFDNSSRFTARTSSAPTGVAENATTGQKYIFHWLSCSFQANDFGNWQKHIERHIVGVNWGEQSNLKLADTSLRVDSSSGTGEPERDGRSPQMEILGPSSFDTSESPGEAGANQKNFTMVPDHIRATNHRTVKEMTTETLGNQFLRETAARVRAYALQTVAKILHQQFAGYSLRFMNPSAAMDAEESSSGGELVASTEPGSPPSQQEGEGADDDDEEDEDNRKKRPRMSKSSLCTPCVRRYVCIYFANAMDSKDSQFLNVDLTRWQTECYRSGFETVTRVKSHLYIHHQWGCKKCYRNFPTAEAHYDHSHGDCQESTETAPVFLSREQISRLKSKKPVPGVDTEEEKWRSIFRLVFPDRENIPSPYWEAISLNCKRQHIDPSHLLNFLKRQFETALLTKELLKPLDQALLGLKIVWGNVVDAITENYPISENLNDMDMASWKTIFEDIVENTARSNTRNGESDPTPLLSTQRIVRAKVLVRLLMNLSKEPYLRLFQSPQSQTSCQAPCSDLISRSLMNFQLGQNRGNLTPLLESLWEATLRTWIKRPLDS
ncbi:hypothetical protein TWF569_006656 [Orbilia oligospora]|nr:hypothetical protein TWF706_011423 [Orbilia oligospora]KAF3140032.1 hypothetical protein TWF594_006427 [Orbilia oligospora]KAF3145026.1 hypothetical protein TWF569_006656 [Orbilia oligospora]